MLTTNYKPIPISQPPEKAGTYKMFRNDKYVYENSYDPATFGKGNGGWFLFNNPQRVTHYLLPVADSIILTREQIEAVWDAAIAHRFDMTDKNAPRVPDKHDYINNLLNKTT